MLIASRRWRALGGDPALVGDIALWVVPAGIIGGRVYFDITTPADIPHVWYGVFAVSTGGLGIWGGVALAALVGVWRAAAARHHPGSVRQRHRAEALLVAQAIGRIGNYFNKELFGGPTTLPWGLEIPYAYRATGGIPARDLHFATFQPTFLYELIWDLALAAFLVWLGHRSTIKPWGLFALYGPATPRSASSRNRSDRLLRAFPRAAAEHVHRDRHDAGRTRLVRHRAAPPGPPRRGLRALRCRGRRARRPGRQPGGKAGARRSPPPVPTNDNPACRTRKRPPCHRARVSAGIIGAIVLGLGQARQDHHGRHRLRISYRPVPRQHHDAGPHGHCMGRGCAGFRTPALARAGCPVCRPAGRPPAPGRRVRGGSGQRPPLPGRSVDRARWTTAALVAYASTASRPGSVAVSSTARRPLAVAVRHGIPRATATGARHADVSSTRRRQRPWRRGREGSGVPVSVVRGCTGSTTGALRLWLKSKSLIRLPRIFSFSRTSGLGPGLLGRGVEALAVPSAPICLLVRCRFSG